jgi:coproporphyrinogen III oxidase
MDKNEIKNWFMDLQDRICASLENLDGTAKFIEDPWIREEGGGGRTRIIQGKNIEKGGVAFSAVFGNLHPMVKKSLEVNDETFFATGVSIVLHASNPQVPIIHMNVRYFETGEQTWWFGGGIDVTPHFIKPDQAKNFHLLMKDVCDRYDKNYYTEFKQWADDYFFIKHRNETRGIGGIFFDKLDSKRGTKEDNMAFVMDVGNAFIPAYTSFFTKNFELPYSDKEKEWQLLRRGRYVEFNLVYDRGTKFGLETDGRTESILMSLPKDARWLYDYHPETNSPEAKTLSLLRKGVDWINYDT